MAVRPAEVGSTGTENGSSQDQKPFRSSWPIWTTLGCVLLWLGLQAVAQLFLLVAYGELTSGFEFGQGTQESVENSLRVVFDGMSATAQALFLLVDTFLVWMVTLCVVYGVVDKYQRAQKVYGIDSIAGSGFKVMFRFCSAALGLQKPKGSNLLLWASPFIGVGTLFLAGLIQKLIPGEEQATQLEALLSTPVGYIVLAVVAVGIAPIAEEIFFRGFIYLPIRQRFGITSGVLVSSILFAAVHILTYGFEVGFIVPLFVMAVVMAILREKSGSTRPCILAHASFNATSLAIFSIEEWYLNGLQ